MRRLRLAAHGLSAPGLSSPTDAVGRLLAVQAQNMSDAAWSIGLRAPGAMAADVAAQLANGRILRTWTMRGTLHLVLPEDARWMLSLLAPRAYGTRAKIWRDAALSIEVFESARMIAVNQLENGRTLSRAALFLAFNEEGIETSANRGSHIIRFLAETQTLLPGPPIGKTPTFVLFDDWVPQSEDLSREQALERLGLRYVRGHGPASATDLAWWSGLTLRDASLALHLGTANLKKIDSDGDTYFCNPDTVHGSLHTIEGEKAATHLLPGFDEYHIGYGDRRFILDDAYKALVGPAKNGLFKSPLVHDGVICGTWSAVRHAQTVAVELALFEKQRPLPIRSVDDAIDHYSAFLGDQ